MPIQFITPSIISSVANTQVTGTITASQIATVNANTGTVSLVMSTPTTANIAAGRYVYDTIIKAPSGDATRILEGIVDVSPSVTRQ